MNNKKKVRILSLDGGGIRGVIPAIIIKYAEEYLKKKVPGTTIADHFDLIAGTSTGGILACIYLTPQDKDRSKAKFTASEALEFFIHEGYNIFNASRQGNFRRLWGLRNATEFDPCYLEDLLEKRFGDTLISNLLKPCLVPTYDMNSKNPFFFTSLEDTTKREFFVRDVARSTSAAPTFFPPAKIKNIAPDAGKDGEALDMINLDGGVFANNPLMCAYAEARKTNFKDRNNDHPSINDMYVLSLGTGGGGFELGGKERSSRWNLLKWAKSMPKIMMDGSIGTVAFQMDQIYKTRQPDDSNGYLRIDVPEEDRNYAPGLSEASPQNVEALLRAGEKTLQYAKGNELDKFLDSLLDC